MKKSQMLFGCMLLAILLLGARAANATSYPYMTFSFQLTTYIQQQLNFNDPPGSLIYKGTVLKSKVTTQNVVETLGTVSGCAAKQPGGVLPIGTQIGIFLGGGDEQGKIFFLNLDYTRVANCDPIPVELFGVTQFDDIEVLNYTHVNMPNGSLKKTSWGHMGFQIYADIGNWITLSGLATELLNSSYKNGKTTRTVKIPASGRGRLDGNAAVFTGTISSKLVSASAP